MRRTRNWTFRSFRLRSWRSFHIIITMNRLRGRCGDITLMAKKTMTLDLWLKMSSVILGASVLLQLMAFTHSKFCARLPCNVFYCLVKAVFEFRILNALLELLKKHFEKNSSHISGTSYLLKRMARFLPNFVHSFRAMSSTAYGWGFFNFIFWMQFLSSGKTL